MDNYTVTAFTVTTVVIRRRDPEFDPSAVHARFVVDKVELG